MKTKEMVYTSGGIPIKVNKKMGLGYIIAALVFFFNPDISIIDFLPDVFGYILLCVGLSKLAFINDSFEEAAAKFKKMIFVSLGKLVAFIMLFGVFNNSERTFGFLLFTFSFMVLDLIFLLPATKCMFEGFIQLTRKYKSEVAYQSTKRSKKLESAISETESKNINGDIENEGRNKKSYIEKIYRLTMVFFVMKIVFRTLPEFIALTSDIYTDNSFIMYMYEYINAYRILAAIAVLVVGIIWLCKTGRFFSKLGRESEFVQNMREEFKEKAVTREGVFVKKALKNALFLFGAGALLSIDFHVSIALENVMLPNIILHEITINFVPDFMSAMFFLIAAVMLRHYVKRSKMLVKVSSLYMVLSLAASALKVYFAVAYGSYSAVNYVLSAFIMFYVICFSTILENVAFITMMVVFAIFMKELIKSYTGYIPSRMDHTTEQLIGSTHKELNTKVWVAVGFAVLSATTASVFDFMLVERHLFAQIFWAIDLVAQIAFACVTLHALFETKDEVESRYMLS